MAYKFILFEGIDGSGKSSIAKGVAEKINGVYYHSPPEIIKSLHEFANRSTPEVRFHYYHLGNVVASEEIKELLKTSHVVCEKYFFSTLAFHQVLLDRKLTPPNVLMPDKIVFVTADINEIDRRLNAREPRLKYEEINFLAKVEKEFEELFSTYKNVIKFDTTGREVVGSVDEVVRLLEF